VDIQSGGPMRFALLILSLGLSVRLAIPSAAQQPPPQRDPQAVTILQRCLVAAGGAQAFGAIQDFLASGTITYYWAGQEVIGSVTAQGKGLTEFRLDS